MNDPYISYQFRFISFFLVFGLLFSHSYLPPPCTSPLVDGRLGAYEYVHIPDIVDDVGAMLKF